MQSVPLRVLARDRGRVLVTDGEHDWSAPIAGRLEHAGLTPITGDWVRVGPGGAVCAIEERRGVLARGGEEPVAANVDLVLIAHAVAEDDHLARLPRFLTLAASAGCDAAVLITKADLLDDAAAAVDAVRAAIAGAAPVLTVAALDGAPGAGAAAPGGVGTGAPGLSDAAPGGVRTGAPGLSAAAPGGAGTGAPGRAAPLHGAAMGVDAVRALVRPGVTAALVGVSGAGKSTLVNALLGDERQATGPVRSGDGRGRHTTVRRELVPLPGGGLLLDSPGVRLMPVASHADAGYGDLAALAEGCRFADCGHEGEPGCAVQAAIAAGSFSASRLAELRRLERQAEHLAAQDDPALRRERQRRWRAVHQAHRKDRW